LLAVFVSPFLTLGSGFALHKHAPFTQSKLSQLLTEPVMAALRSAATHQTANVLDEAIAIQQIPAPTFREAQRAAYVAQRFRAQNLTQITTDDLYNVYGCLPGTHPHLPAVLVAAHTDTVFDEHTVLNVRHTDRRIHGPGIGDNSLGVAALLGAAHLLRSYRLPSDVWFVANSREEGLGDLGGMKAVHQRLRPRLGAGIILEGMAFGRVYHSGIAVRRLKITCRGQGGHSWLHYGRASAVHGLMRLGATITTLQPPEHPRTTFNIGVISGGTTVNSIAAESSMLLDLRSEDPDTLARFEQHVLALVHAAQEADLTYTVDVVGDRPAGSIPRTHPLVDLTRQTLVALGAETSFETGSTDANVLLAEGLAAVTIGITHGSNAHRTDEYIETAPTAKGLTQLVWLVAAVASAFVDAPAGK
jgi:acetylornithine deacetylase/succinyl-diaminopimelate desuccinylase-like protein